MTLEQLDKVLVHPNIAIKPTEDTPYLNRMRTFTVRGQEYVLEWWCNALYLHCGELLVCADHVEQSGTWPNRSKLNLQFSLRAATSAVIALEPYDYTEGA